MDYITIDLQNDNLSSVYDKTAGASGESYIKGVEFILPEEFADWSVFVDIENPSGLKYRQELLVAVAGKIKYDFTANDLCAKGKLFLDLILVHNNQISKPFRGEFAVKQAICASDSPSSEVVTIVTAEITESLQQLMALYPVLSNLSENTDAVLQYKNKPYATAESLSNTVNTLVSATISDRTLILTSKGGG